MNKTWKIRTSQYSLVLSQIAVIADQDNCLIVYMAGNTPPIVIKSDDPGYALLIAWSELDDKIRVDNKTLVLSHINDVWQDEGAIGVHMAGHAPGQGFEPGTPGLDKLLAWSEQDQWKPWIIE